MVFSSPRFFIFLACLLTVLAVTGGNERRKRILAGASCLFYAAWDYRYLGLLLLIGVVSYVAAEKIARSSSRSERKMWLAFSTVVHLGLLAYFKYYDFFAENWNHVSPAAGHLPILQILLPAGISFYTFKTLSYTIDVYRGELAPARTRLDYLTFVTFFPELIAGPIVRASVFLPQLGRTIGPSRARLAAGASLFLVGLTKKLFIADRVAVIADAVFAAPDMYSTTAVWIGLVAYAVQIYCDFSGYSDMAIGTAKMVGYDLPENFNMPYASVSIAEFWRRWHMTLSFWLRDYLYIPLGGNRRGPTRTYANLLATMAIGGLWHGASWNFVLWGTLHGLALSIHRFYERHLAARFPIPTPLAGALTLLFVVLCWVPFRARDLPTTLLILRKLSGLGGPGAEYVSIPVVALCTLVVVGHVLGSAIAAIAEGRQRPSVQRLLAAVSARVSTDEISGTSVRFGMRTPPAALLVWAWLLALFLFSPSGTSPFLYFQF